MDKITLFFKRLKRFIGYFLNEIGHWFKRNFTWNHVFQGIIEPVAVILLIAALASILGLILLCATILTSSALHFSGDFTGSNFQGAVVVSTTVAVVGGLIAGLTWTACESISRMFYRAWSDSSTRSLATKLWE